MRDDFGRSFLFIREKMTAMELLQRLVGKQLDNVIIPGYMEHNFFHPEHFALWISVWDGPTIRLGWKLEEIQYSEVSTISYEFDIDAVVCAFADAFTIELGVIEEVESEVDRAELKIRTTRGVLTIDARHLEGFHYYFIPYC
ncbi:hypothetical protein CFELI_09825 [Corynebacterium felinum]|nr:hypothetical protein [Corynebacterium felinum]WJY95567.1 hypothetical protein CFELI_09825 [Corynebacterium felinum]